MVLALLRGPRVQPCPQHHTALQRLEREIAGYLTGLPTSRPDLRHPVPPITSLFHPYQVPNGRAVAQKKPRKCQLEGCGELLEGRDGQALAGITLALTQEIWGRGDMGRFEMYDSIRAEQAKGLESPPPSQLLTA